MAARRSVGQRFRRFFSTQAQLEAEDLEARALACGASPIATAEPRQRVTFRGALVSVTSSDDGWLEAQLDDGSGSVRLVWMGQRRIECLLPGRHVIVRGRLAAEGGGRVIYNPEWSLVS